jgi:hypothetical protein
MTKKLLNGCKKQQQKDYKAAQVMVGNMYTQEQNEEARKQTSTSFQ